MSVPVFPQAGNGYGRDHDPGMSLHTLFAAMSMLGQRASGKLDLDTNTSDQVSEVAKSDADALINRLRLNR